MSVGEIVHVVSRRQTIARHMTHTLILRRHRGTIELLKKTSSVNVTLRGSVLCLLASPGHRCVKDEIQIVIKQKLSFKVYMVSRF